MMTRLAPSALTRLALALAIVAGLFVAARASALEPSSKDDTKAPANTAAKMVKIKLKDGKEITGELVAKTPEVVRIKTKVNGSDVTQDLLADQIEEITELPNAAPADAKPAEAKPETAKPDAGAKTAANAEAAAKTPENATPVTDPAATESGPAAHRVYFAELKGDFGRNITQTVIRKLTSEARKENADTIIFYLDGSWDPQSPFQGWSELFRYEDLGPALTDEVEQAWPKGKPPRVAIWVKRAMGGASLMPLCVKEIYMTDDGMIGGMFGLDLMMQGNRTVVEKQRSLRLQHAAGWVVKGGYDTRIMYAMGVVEYILSYRYVGDQVEFVERLPDGPNEVLLTDAGPDTMADMVRGKGRAYLNITAKIGRDIKVSRGTVNTKDDLFSMMGLDRNRVDVGNAKKITDQWDRRIANAEKELTRLWGEDYRGTRVQGNYDERTRARGKQKKALKQLLDLLNNKELKEVFDDRFRNELRLPPDSYIQSLIDQIELDQQRDQK